MRPRQTTESSIHPYTMHLPWFSPTVEALEESQKQKLDVVHYGRYGTPTTFAFEEAVAKLEGGYRTVGYPSGLGALSGALLSFLKAGDHPADGRQRLLPDAEVVFRPAVADERRNDLLRSDDRRRNSRPDATGNPGRIRRIARIPDLRSSGRPGHRRSRTRRRSQSADGQHLERRLFLPAFRSRGSTFRSRPPPSFWSDIRTPCSARRPPAIATPI